MTEKERNKLTVLEGRSRRNNILINGIFDEPGQTREDCKANIQHLLAEELDTKNVIIECAHRVKAQRQKNKKLKPKPVVCKLTTFVDKTSVLENSHY